MHCFVWSTAHPTVAEREGGKFCRAHGFGVIYSARCPRRAFVILAELAAHPFQFMEKKKCSGCRRMRNIGQRGSVFLLRHLAVGNN